MSSKGGRGKGEKGKERKEKESRSTRAGLTFPVGKLTLNYIFAK